MKKVAALISLFFFALTLSACEVKVREEEPPSTEITPTAYEISVELSPATNSLSVVTDISYSVPADDIAAIKLNLYANLYREGNTLLPEELYSSIYPGGHPSYGGVKIREISSQGVPLSYDLGREGTLITVRFPEKMKEGDRISLHIEEEVLLANAKHRLGYYDGYYHLSRFYPEVCPYIGGCFRSHPYTPYGDPFVSEAADFSVIFTLPEEYVVAASAKEDLREMQGTFSIYRYHIEGARDFAIITSPFLKKREGTLSGTPLSYYYASDRHSAETFSFLESVFSCFCENFGSYPYSSFAIVSAPFFEAGMEHSGVGLVSNTLSEASFKEALAHETAHQWWYGKVGNDEFTDPWMDEGLAEYSVAYYYKAQSSKAAYRSAIKQAESAYETRLAIKGQEGTRFDRPLSELSDGYYERVYCGGLLLFHTLAQMVGSEALHTALRGYADRYAGKIAQPSDLIATLSASLDRDYTLFFDLWLSASLPVL